MKTSLCVLKTTYRFECFKVFVMLLISVITLNLTKPTKKKKKCFRVKENTCADQLKYRISIKQLFAVGEVNIVKKSPRFGDYSTLLFNKLARCPYMLSSRAISVIRT